MNKIIFSTYDDIKNPYYGGGGAIAIHQVAKRLINKFDIRIISWNHSGIADETIDGVRYHRIGCKFINPKIGMLIFQLSLPFLIVTNKFDIWLESFCPPFSTSFLPLFTRKPVVGVIHMLSAGDMARKYNLPIFRWVEWIGLKLYTKMIATSSNFRDIISETNPRAKIEVIPNGIDRVYVKKGIKKNQILFLGRLEINQKGLDLLIKSFNIVKKSLPKLKLIVAGSGIASEIKKFNKLVSESKFKEDIILLGKVERDRKEQLLKESKLMAMSSRFETFSMTTLEALSFGLPVVSFRIAGLDWIDEKTIIKTTPFSTIKFASNIVAVCKSSSIRSKYIQNGLEVAKKHRWTRISNLYFKYLKNI
jgi:glycosyltransferase involved in cell wall biosynthesis